MLRSVTSVKVFSCKHSDYHRHWRIKGGGASSLVSKHLLASKWGLKMHLIGS